MSAAPPSVEIEVTERTKSVEIGVHPCDTTTFAAPSRLFLLPTTKLVQIGVLFSFSYLLVLIQLYFKNWILFCVLCLDYVRNGENERKKNPKERERIDIIVAGIIFKAEKLI